MMAEFKTPFPEIKVNSKKMRKTKLLLRTLVYSFAIFGLLFIVLLFAALGMLGGSSKITHPVPSKAVITLDLDQPYSETRSDDLLAELSEMPTMSFYDLVKALNVAALDKRVKAVVAHINNTELGLAQIQNLRQVIANFRSTGKKAYLYSTGMGSFGGGTDEYYLASAFDEIWMQPNTEVGITGLNIAVPFLEETLDKLGIKAEFYARHEYKNAMASLMNKTFTPQYREEMEQMGQSIFGQMVADISDSRGIDAAHLKELINQAPLNAETALKEKLIDRVAYKPDLLALVLDQNKAEMVDMADYEANITENNSKYPALALLVVDGVIESGESFSNPLKGEMTVGAETVIRQLDEIAKNKNVKALIVRINSPGGSYTASNEIWNAINRLKEDKKIPVIVSMGDYAASGGYFIALAGDKIIAEPSTITGSIGVLGGKMVLSGLWKKLNVNWEEIKFGQNAGILSANHPFSPSELKVFNKSLDNVYKDFTAKTAEARKIEPQKLDKLARGRVWTGAEAVKNGLIDQLGGLDDAIAKAKEMGGIKPNKRFNIIYYPKAKTLSEKLSELLGGGSKISVNKVMNQIGLDPKSVNMLKRMKNEAVLPPFNINM